MSADVCNKTLLSETLLAMSVTNQKPHRVVFDSFSGEVAGRQTHQQSIGVSVTERTGTTVVVTTGQHHCTETSRPDNRPDTHTSNEPTCSNTRDHDRGSRPMTVFAFDRDWTVDVNPHPNRQAVPLDWVRTLAHETAHPVYAIGNQDLADEAVAVSRAAEQALGRIRSAEGPR